MIRLALACMVWAVAVAATAQDRVSTGVLAISNNPANRVAPVLAADESFTSFTLDPGVRVTLQQADRDKTLHRHLVCYFLPNGNTTEQTAGCTSSTELDFRYSIQHIAAQTRRVRELQSTVSVTTAYFEADTLSWPAWRQAVPGSSQKIVAMVDEVRRRAGAPDATVDFVAHSGGGSFINNFMNGSESLPEWLQHIVYIDANYSYEDADGHGEKLLQWLRQDDLHRLVVLAYDDRRIKINGKPIVSDTGGTWRATDRMARYFEKSLEFEPGAFNELQTSSALSGRLLLLRHPNPEDKILHTVLVEKNGFVYGVLNGRLTLPAADMPYSHESAYRKHILP